MNFKIYIPLLAALFLMISCNDDINKRAETFQVKKHSYQKTSDIERFQGPTFQKVTNTLSTSPTQKFSYQLPKNWTIIKPKQFREVNIAFTENPSAACYLTVLTNNGGGILTNVNRWRGQFGLRNITDDNLKTYSPISFFKEQTPLIELTGEFKKKTGWSMLACFFTDGSKAYSLKCTGPTDFIRLQKENFIHFASNIKEEQK